MKKMLIIVSIPLILICLLLFISSNSNDDDSIYAKFDQIKKHSIQLERVCKDKNLVNYIKNNNNKELTNTSDNQGGGNIAYYVAYFGKKKIGIFGIFGKDNELIKITKVVQYKPEKNN
jgi:hypothetical protein